MTKKVKSHDGFTLAELLIVVAIIAVLVAVSIPIFTRQLEKARESADVANMRAAKAAFISAYLSGDIEEKGVVDSYYDADKGVLVPSWSDILNGSGGYGEGTETPGYTELMEGYDTSRDYKDAVIICTFDESDGKLYMSWADTEGDTSAGAPQGNIGDPVIIDPQKDIFNAKSGG